MTKSEPLYALTAEELVSGFAAGTFTPLDALGEVIERIDAANPSINALIVDARLGAVTAADASTRRWQDGTPLGPIDGVPITIKDNLLVGGMRATWGSAAHRNYVPEHDEIPVGRLRAAGAVILGKTNVPEFTLQGYASNAVFGTTTNPLAPGRTPGGSTGGGAAAAAAGIGAVAIGTDGGGSLRRPAAHCGLFGFKPSIGQVPRGSGFPQILADFEVVGPIARSLSDLRAAFFVLRGHDSRDPRSLIAEVGTPGVHSRPRIGYFPRVGDAPVDSAIAHAVDSLAAALAESGAMVERVEAPFLPERVHTHWGRVAAAGLAWHAGHLDSLDGLGANALSMIEVGRGLSAADYVEAIETCLAIRSEAAAPFETFDFLLSPTTAALAWPADEAYPAIIDGREVGPRGHAVFTAWANVAGLAALEIPVAMTEREGGIGAQILAAPGRDLTLFDFSISNPVLRGLTAVRPTTDLPA